MTAASTPAIEATTLRFQDRPYSVELIHRWCDWDATLKFRAPNARVARTWALRKMAHPDDWVVVRAHITEVKS